MDKRVMKDINNLFDFVHYANSLGACLAGIYNVPYLREDKDAKEEIERSVKLFQEKYPEISKKHIVAVFSKAAWLQNR